jgi:hypothetical protein
MVKKKNPMRVEHRASSGFPELNTGLQLLVNFTIPLGYLRFIKTIHSVRDWGVSYE